MPRSLVAATSDWSAIIISGLGVDGRSPCHESLIIVGVFSWEKIGERRSNATCVVRVAQAVVEFRCIVLRSSVMLAACPKCYVEFSLPVISSAAAAKSPKIVEVVAKYSATRPTNNEQSTSLSCETLLKASCKTFTNRRSASATPD